MLIELAESGLIPDSLIRLGIRRLLARRLAGKDSKSFDDFVAELRTSPLAVETEAANRQHYEVPAEFFQAVLGPRLKYSACWFESETATLADAESAMLRETCRRAELADGQRVLELGCGWGSLTLWMAEHYPHSQITALSNSSSQARFIRQRADAAGFSNVRVITSDMRDFDTREQFDRIVSVEMFEHMRNYQLLLSRVSRWLADDGLAFVHIFCHRDRPYLFETDGAANWMGRHFFTGGMMPSEHLFAEFAADLTIQQQWRVGGLHYWRTCEAWLQNLDTHRDLVLACFEKELGTVEAKRLLQRWRMFFLACAELFRYRDGQEWFVSHYLFRQTGQPASNPTRRTSEFNPARADTSSGELISQSDARQAP